MNKHIKDLVAYLTEANSRFTASEQIVSRLQQAGFTELHEKDSFKTKKGGKYYIRRLDTSVIAFVLGSKALHQSGFQMAASHIDSPGFKLKLDSAKTDKGVCKVGMEVYGGPIIHTWLDRELSLSGKVIVKTKTGVKSVIIDLKKPVAIIPNAAIHMNRKLNDGFEYNKQTHLQAMLCGNCSQDDPLRQLLAKHLKVKPADILEDELYFYDMAPATLAGIDEQLIVSGRLDNLGMTHAILQALLDVEKPQNTVMGIFYDHEEIGSQTPQGAFSALLAEVLERISLSQSTVREDYYRALRQSFLISCDMAHAYHPAYAEKYDPDYSPGLNQGPVIKLNANFSYASTANSSLRFAQLCEAAKVPFQKFIMRNDQRCGSTVGPIVSAHLGIEAVDIGNPMWAMHSVRETAGVKDHEWLIEALCHYFI